MAPIALERLPDRESIEVPAGIFSLYRIPAFPLFDTGGARVHPRALGAHEAGQVLILRDDVPALRLYLRHHLHRIAVTDSVSPAHRAWALHRALTYEVADLLQHLDERAIPAGLMAAIDECAHFVLRSPRTADALLATAGGGEPSLPVHMARTSLYALLLGHETGIRAVDRLGALAVGGVFADIGMSGQPFEALLAPEAGAPDDMLREHPGRSLAVTRRMGVTRESTQAAALSHHERLDGEGYPAGLAGGAMPFAARSVAIAARLSLLCASGGESDVYALLSEMATDVGAYDPELLRAFVRLLGRQASRRQQPRMLAA
ncbi:MAG: hypothetical protein GEU80_00265 [Dehalococcoidia bacterium]|nr:hypothetical protein [Dehalococcoidia bacterium]